MPEALVLCSAALLAGALNAVAGGGTFLTFPALVCAGLPVIAANASSAVAVFPGYLSGALGFRRELAAIANPSCPAPLPSRSGRTPRRATLRSSASTSGGAQTTAGAS